MCLEFLSLADGVELFLHSADEDELHIRFLFVIDQEVRFTVIKPCFGNLFFYCYSFTAKSASISRF